MVTDQDKEAADRLLAKIETAVGELPRGDSALPPLIADILEAVNGLRTLLDVQRSH
jgi:hypothetical protein